MLFYFYIYKKDILDSMRSLLEYINECLIYESKCKPEDYTKHNYKYPLIAIDILLNDGFLKLGEKGEKETMLLGTDLTDEEKNKLEILKNNIFGSTVEDFNDAIKSTGIKWTQIFKGTLSGYTDGLSSKNKGNAFEDYFLTHYSDMFEPEIKKIVNYNKIEDIKSVGGQNNKRPLTFNNDSITCGNLSNNFNIGETISDITLFVDNDKEIYLSLKYGDKVTFVNTGVRKIFTKNFFDGDELSNNGKLILDLFCINEDRFRNVFTSYKEDGTRKQKAAKDIVDITDKLNNNKLFEKFIKSAIGWGYILIHSDKNGNIDYYDLLTEDKLNKLVSHIKKAYIEYPKDGEAKRVNIIIKYDDIKLTINFRSKFSGITYPTHIMCDYEFEK